MTEEKTVKRNTKPSGLRLSESVMALLKRLSEKTGYPMTTLTAMAIRDLAKKEGVPDPADEETR